MKADKNTAKLTQLIDCMSYDDIISIHNEYVTMYGTNDPEIFALDEYTINELLDGMKPYDLLNSIDNFSTSHDYWFWSADGYILSFRERDYYKHFEEMTGEIACVAIDNNKDFGNKKIRSFLNQI